MAILRREIASLRAAARPKAATIDDEAVHAREIAKQKRIEDREAAKREYAEAAAKQALLQPEKDRARAEWLAEDAARKREKNRVNNQKWRAANPEKANANLQKYRAANPEKVKASNARYKQKRREAAAAQKQNLLGGAP